MAIRMLCRNKVTDYERWWTVFSRHAGAHHEAGLVLQHVWRALEDSTDVFFVFEVRSRTEAQAFIDAPGSAEAGKEAGVLSGEYHFVESVAGY